MWLMTTKNRPAAAERALSACWDTGMRSPGVVFVDGEDHAQYDTIRLPPNWQMVKGADVGGCGNLAGSRRYIFERYPDERTYGFLSDDNIPVTPNWCEMVEAAAYPFRLVHCRDDFVSDMEGGLEKLQGTVMLGGAQCYGGDLVRFVGYWAPPGIVQGSIDWFWTALLGGTPLAVYRHDIVVRHDNWRTGRRQADDNDNLRKPHILKDIKHVGGIIKTAEFAALRERVIAEYEGSLSCG